MKNLEPSSVSRQFATILLETALEEEKWELAKELVRFLRAIGMYIHHEFVIVKRTTDQTLGSVH